MCEHVDPLKLYLSALRSSKDLQSLGLQIWPSCIMSARDMQSVDTHLDMQVTKENKSSEGQINAFLKRSDQTLS